MINPGHLLVWVDGSLVDEHEARISPFDHGLLTGDGVFETLRVYRAEPYCWRRHYERLARSALLRVGVGAPVRLHPLLDGAQELALPVGELDAGAVGDPLGLAERAQGRALGGLALVGRLALQRPPMALR